MEYIYLGRSGLEVSRIGLGAIPFGTQFNEQECIELVAKFEDVGGNYIDTANLYGGGMRGTNSKLAGTSEHFVGKALKGRRERFVIATKGYWLMEDVVRPNSIGLSRKYLAKNIEDSLKRLNTDYIDLYQCHVWDFYTPIEETIRVLDDFVRAGKIRYLGVSNWDGWHVVKANEYAKRQGLSPIISNQIWYTLADRVAENSIVPACKDQEVSIIAWGALAEGFLTGRFARNKTNAASKRFDTVKDTEMCSLNQLMNERNWNVLDIMKELAGKYSSTIPNIAIGWLLQSGNCDAVLLGGSKLSQYISNFDVMKLKMEQEDIERLRKASEMPKPYPNSFYDLFCHKSSEYYGGLR